MSKKNNEPDLQDETFFVCPNCRKSVLQDGRGEIGTLIVVVESGRAGTYEVLKEPFFEEVVWGLLYIGWKFHKWAVKKLSEKVFGCTESGPLCENCEVEIRQKLADDGVANNDEDFELLTGRTVVGRSDYKPLHELWMTLNNVFGGEFRIFFKQDNLFRFKIEHSSGIGKYFAAPHVQMIDHQAVCYRFYLEMTRKAWGNDMGDKP